ncbi:MAG TPA: methyltransferase domain-containing protein, partial [Candidatus Cloacimonadota bacterium]|nr:methyltransferase domain-containing protein [Candidatus Cloacimonadota bacterium]
ANLNGIFSSDYSHLPFADNTFDLGWNFSALWFVPDLPVFLQELMRVTQKVILICVPNRSGIGYLTQKYLGRKDLKALLHEEHIIPRNIKKIMSQNNWKLLDAGYIDCPPWPDIGMPKEKFLKIFGLSWLLPAEKEHEPLSIMDYYNGTDPDFPPKMMKHFWWEKIAPAFLKKFWAHHRFLLFIPQNR